MQAIFFAWYNFCRKHETLEGADARDGERVDGMILARQTPLLVVPGAYILFVLALPFIEHTPVKPALRAVDEIQRGMTKEQVRAVIDRHFRAGGPFKRPVVAEYEDIRMFSLDPDSEAYGAALINVEFVGGKVSSAEFLPD